MCWTIKKMQRLIPAWDFTLADLADPSEEDH